MGTSGNFSVVIDRDPLRLAITPSATFKGELRADQILEMDERARGASRRRRARGPSAEALLHVEIVRARGAGAVLHTHSIWSTLLSDAHSAMRGGFAIEGYEMLKGLEGVRTHEHREWLPIVENDQDMARLSGVVRGVLDEHPDAHGFLLRASRALHLGRRPAAGRAPRRDSGVPVGGGWEKLVKLSAVSFSQVAVTSRKLPWQVTMAVVKIPSDNVTLTDAQDVHDVPGRARHRVRALDAEPRRSLPMRRQTTCSTPTHIRSDAEARAAAT